VTAGVGTLVAVVGAVVWTISDKQFGVILVLSGLVIAVLGLVMRLIMWGVAKSK
jgi:hypothetical protein